MLLFYSDPRMLHHRPWSWHPESPARLSSILEVLRDNGQLVATQQQPVKPANDADLARVHAPSYVREIALFERGGGGQYESDTFVSSGTDLAARLAAGAAIDAVRGVVSGPNSRAFCAVRPPGHHARPSTAMGFCIYSNAAVAAAYAREVLGLDRILVVDFDVHHGNGTQEAFYDDSQVGFLSIHRFPFYPGTGDLDETGSGAGLGFTRNIPLPHDTRPNDLISAFRSGLETMANKVRPQLVILSAGFDAHRADPVGGLGLEVEHFEDLTRAVIEVAEAHADGRIVSLLEGGYHLQFLPMCVEAHLKVLGVPISRTATT
ncbi:MAG: histone deacetylase [Isosphaeraceae bacterium]